MAHDVRRAVAMRDAATARLRRVTAAAAAVGLGSTVLFAGLAAGSTHLRRVVHTRRPPARATHKPVRVEAPAPPLVAVAGPAPTPTPPPAPSPSPSPAPTPVTQPPVVVSGGS
jgi:hypothetical protein